MHAPTILAIFTGLCWIAGPDDPTPTRVDFIREVLDARPTDLTSKFHDDVKSYHVNKEDLARGLIEEAGKRKFNMRGFLIAGPMGPLWSYTVVAFLREGDKVRVNLVVFPHARITYKSTGLVPADRFEKWVAEMQATGILQPELPPAARDEKDNSKKEHQFTFLFYTSGQTDKDRRTTYASPEKLDGEKLERFQTALNGILTEQKPTYSVYQDESAPQKPGATPG